MRLTVRLDKDVYTVAMALAKSEQIAVAEAINLWYVGDWNDDHPLLWASVGRTLRLDFHPPQVRD
jgi:hypothetical protein